MSNIFPIGISHIPHVGTPTVILGPLTISVPSIVHSPVVSTLTVGQVNLQGYGISNDQQAFGYPKIYNVSAVNEANTQIESQVPSFILDDDQNFLSFIKEYYRWSERKEGPLYALRRLLAFQNIDTTTSALMEFFFREYAPTFPRSIALTPAMLIKHIKEFYLAKGTEKSYRFLFRVFFGEEIDFYYPRIDILRFSDGKWIQDKTIKCILNFGDPAALLGNRIIGSDTKATAFVEKVLRVQDGTITSYELFLNRSSIIGKFAPNETIKSEDGTVSLRLLPIITKIVIDIPGQGYQVGQQVVIGGTGFDCKARITSVSLLGAVQAVEVYQFGVGYDDLTTTVTFPPYDGVSQQAYGHAVFDTIATYPGYFLNADGMFSSLKYIEDNDYYQQWSYVIKSAESSDRYADIVKKLVHPAGFKMFSQVESTSVIDASAEITPDLNGNVALEMELFTDLHWDFDDFSVTAPQELVYVEAGCSVEDSEVEIFTEAQDSDMAPDSEQLGPTWRDFERFRTDYRPTPVLGQPTDEILQVGYYDQFAHTPIKAFVDVQLSDIVNRPNDQINFLPETIITQEVGP